MKKILLASLLLSVSTIAVAEFSPSKVSGFCSGDVSKCEYAVKDTNQNNYSVSSSPLTTIPTGAVPMQYTPPASTPYSPYLDQMNAMDTQYSDQFNEVRQDWTTITWELASENNYCVSSYKETTDPYGNSSTTETTSCGGGSGNGGTTTTKTLTKAEAAAAKAASGK